MAIHRDPILIVLIAGIGDLILASKGIRSIRRGYPEAEIHLLTSTDAAPVARNYPYIDRVWSFPIRELRRDKGHALAVLGLIRRLRRFRFRLAVNLYSVASAAGVLKMGLLFQAIRAEQKVGHDRYGFSLFLTNTIAPDTFENRHFAEALTSVAIAAGGIPDDKGTDIFWDRSAEDRWSPLFRGGNGASGRPVVGIHPGSDQPLKRWAPERYSLVADSLTETEGARIVLLGGPSETQIAGTIAQRMRHEAVNLAGKMSIDELSYVISRLDLLVTNDSGPMHIGAAAGTPLVALFGPSMPEQFGPCAPPDRCRLVSHAIDCRPCRQYGCPRPRCMEIISPEEVSGKCDELLRLHRQVSQQMGKGEKR
jgi:lipopolysaccharide heptosyltransferase II